MPARSPGQHSNGNVAHYQKWQSIKDDNHCPVFSRTWLSSISFVNGRSHATQQVSVLESANAECWQVCLEITGGTKTVSLAKILISSAYAYIRNQADGVQNAGWYVRKQHWEQRQYLLQKALISRAHPSETNRTV